MVPKDQCEHIKQYCIDRNNTWSKLYIERYRPRKTLTVATFTEVINKLISFMHTEVGLLSWVSHTTIARAIGINKDAVRCYLRAATLIGAVKVKYTYAGAAHEQTIRYYPNYTDHTDGLTFNMMLVSEDGKPRRLNYYTVIGCEHWNGRKYNSLPADWKIEVIRLCSKQKSIHLHEAERLAAKYRIAALDPIINHPTRKPKTQRPIVYVNLRPDHPDQPANTLRKRRGKSKADSHVGPESASANEGVNTTTHKLYVYILTQESASANEGVRPCVLSTRKQADKGSAPSSSKTESPVRPESASANEGVRPCGNEREVLTHPERLILTHLVLQDSRSGQGRQFRFTPPFGSSWTSSTRESGSSRRSSRRSGNDASGGPKAPRSSARPGRSGSTR